MCIFSTLVWPTLNEGQNNSKSRKNRWPCLSLKRVSKSTLKFQLRESRQKCIFSSLFDQPLTRAKIATNLIKIGFHVYLSNSYLNPLSKLNLEKVDDSAYFQPWFGQPWTRAEITLNLIKIGFHAYLSNGYLNLL